MPYSHLTEHERYLIDQWHRAGWSLRRIGRRLDRSAGTISRELTRHGGSRPGAYRGYQAHARALTRRRRPRRPRRMAHRPLADYVHSGLVNHWSPQQIAQRLPLDHPDDPAMRISHEAIYRWVYAQDNLWHTSLRRRHRRRRPRSRGAARRGQIVGRIDIARRPAVVQRRTRLGDWESDTLAGAVGKGGLATHVERRSRLLLAAKLDTRQARHFARRSLRAFAAAAVPPRACRTLTADNGKEFADFKRLERGLGLRVYFARPHAAWERGTNENTNGLLREYFPKATDFTGVSHGQVARVVRSLNNRPRKCLGYRTPCEVFTQLAGVALQI
jgi:IS30 family transposase